MPIELEHVTHTYMTGTPQAVPALCDLCMHIEDGEMVGIIGHTGCGKSTMIQLVAGLISPTGGRILLDGQDINAKDYNRSVLRGSVGIVFQYPEYQLFERTVEKDVAFGLKHSGLSRDEVAARVRWALEIMDFDFESVRTQSPMALSGGEKRRVAIAGVLAARTKILIFDEPIAGLDPIGRDAFLKLITRLNQDGTTIIMISHNSDAIAEYTRRIAVLDNGRLVADDTPKRVFSDIALIEKLELGVSTPREIAAGLAKRGVYIPEDTVIYGELLSALKLKLGGDSA